LPESDALEAALEQTLSDEKRQHGGKNSQRGDVVNEDDAGDVQSALEVFRCRAGRRSSVGNNLVDDCCERYKQIKRMKWIRKKAQTLRKLGVFHRHCPHKHAQTKIQNSFSLRFAGSGLLFAVLRHAAGGVAWQSKCVLGSVSAARERREEGEARGNEPSPFHYSAVFRISYGLPVLKQVMRAQSH
jgi:hypothetical protein